MSRIKSVDIFRLIAITGVISGHTMPFHNHESGLIFYDYLCYGINQTIRFVIPFFCIVSGFFWGTKVRLGKDPIFLANQMAKRIGIIFLAWCIIYLLPYNITVGYEHGIFGPIKVAYQSALHTLSVSPAQLLMRGTKPHLWFFACLLFSVYITAIFVNNKLPVVLIFVSIFLYIIGVLAGSYVHTPIGFRAHLYTRDGPFFGTVGFATGYFLSKANPTSKWFYYGLSIFCIGWCLQFCEVYFLWVYYNLKPIHEYVFSTYFMGLGIAVLSLSNHPKLQNDSLSNLGKLTLGIYASHWIFVDLLRVIDDKIDHPIWEIGYVVIVLILSIALTKLLSRIRWVKRIVV